MSLEEALQFYLVRAKKIVPFASHVLRILFSNAATSAAQLARRQSVYAICAVLSSFNESKCMINWMRWIEIRVYSILSSR